MESFQRRIAAAERNASRFRRCRERAVGNPQHIKTWIRYASMRQIHAVIKHFGEEMLFPTDEPHFRKLQDVMKVDDMSVGFGHGESKHKDNSKNKFRETTTIS